MRPTRNVGICRKELQGVFGASSVVVAVLWRMLSEYDMVPEGGKIVHILWTLHFFHAYPKEGHACAIAGGSGGAVDPKTHRKLVLEFIYAIADAESIKVSVLLKLM